MSDRERLIDLMIEDKKTDPETGSFTDYLADYLLEHGVIVLPCKVGDRVYSIEMSIADKRVKYKVCEIPFSLTLWENGWEDIFLTREEAERALKGREKNG